MAYPSQQYKITATGTQKLDAGDPARVSRVVVQVSGTFSGWSATFTGDLLGTSGVGTTLGYTTPSSSTPSTTAITAGGLYYVITDGVLPTLNTSALTSGTVVVDVLPLIG